MLSFTQSSISFPVKVLAGLSSVLGEADARWSFAGVFPSIVSKRTGEVHFQSRVVADVSQLPVSRGFDLVAGSRESEGCFIHVNSSRADSVCRCILLGVGGTLGRLLGIRSVDY